LTNKWQKHQQDVRTRSDLVERIGNAVGRFAGAVQVEAYAAGAVQSDYNTAYVEWKVESEAILTQIEAYIDSKSAIVWSDYAYDMTWVYYVFKRNGAVNRSYELDRVAHYLKRPLTTFDGLYKASPFRSDGRVNPTYESALRELVLQLRLKERAIISDILG
jgi:hypothetical protein